MLRKIKNLFHSLFLIFVHALKSNENLFSLRVSSAKPESKENKMYIKKDKSHLNA